MIDHQRYEKTYCKKCEPDLIFIFKVASGPEDPRSYISGNTSILKTNLDTYPIVNVIIPTGGEDKMSKMDHVLFYDMIADNLKISVNRVVFDNMTKIYYLKGLLYLCPAEYILDRRKEHKTFNVLIL